MLYDCGINTGKLWDFYKRNIPEDKQLEFSILALTPGMPAEYLIRGMYLGGRGFEKSLVIVDRLRSIAQPLALENAASITMEDGYNMLLAVKRPYRGCVPHWSSLALSATSRERGWQTLQTELRVSAMAISRWRKSKFHPLTLHRMSYPPSGYAGRQYQLPPFVPSKESARQWKP